jgi:hypothetical protein
MEETGPEQLARVREKGMAAANDGRDAGGSEDTSVPEEPAAESPSAGVASVTEDERYDRDSHGPGTRGRGGTSP